MLDLWISLRMWVITLALCSGFYPLVLFTCGKLIFSNKAEGSLIYNKMGKPIGSHLIAQGFIRPEYLWPRPSAVDYDASAAGGSNLAPSNPKLRERAGQTIERYALDAGMPIPGELIAASGSGLDPHITVEGAFIQVSRIAAARNIESNRVMEVIRKNTQPGNPWTPALVHVLTTNLALDRELGVVKTQGI